MNTLLPQSKVKHLNSRAGFGLRPGARLPELKHLFREAEAVHLLTTVEPPDFDEQDMRQLVRSDSVRKQVMKDFLGKSRENLMKLNIAWMDQIIGNPSLRERMTFFWHGHFACRTLVPYFAQHLNNTIRENAMGSFRKLLLAVSKEPAMLQFLNNQQNRKDHPNENFAREVMELFTLGRGNYSETDVKEAARAFTGWSFNFKGEFQFRPRQHDEGIKTFRGKSKNFSGEEILEALLEDPATARFITKKVYHFFVSDEIVNDAIVKAWADEFYSSDYDIEKLLKTIFQSETFYETRVTGNRIKSPIELLLGLQLHTGAKFENPQSALFIQRALSQVAFYPPNVSGWPSGKAWIDSSSLSFRIALPMLLFGGKETDFEASDDGDANGLGKAVRGNRRLHCKADWPSLAGQFTKSSSAETQESIEGFLLSRPASSANQDLVKNLAATSGGDPEFVKRVFMGYMSLPEYQLC